MKVLKFGGTSVGSAQKIRKLSQLLHPDKTQIVVLSAVAGTTNSLERINSFLLKDDQKAALSEINILKNKYDQLIKDLFGSKQGLAKGTELIDHHFETLENLVVDDFSEKEGKIILAQGELLSTKLLHYHLEEKNIASVWLPALDFMKIDEDHEPRPEYIKEKLTALLGEHSGNKIFITQGYICRNHTGAIDNLKRGGSDYTASLIGAVLKADEIQIWTDIDGMHNNDPRIVSYTRPIKHISFNEAAELAYFGAKVLHPQSVLPAQKYNVPVRLLDTENPEGAGTLISGEGAEKGIIKAIAAKDNISVVNIHSTRMLMAYGFLRRVFEVFEKYKTPIDMITTSEVAVSLTVDQEDYIEDITEEVNQFGTIQVVREQTIICVVGDFSADTQGYAAAVLDSVKHLPIHMISYGASDNNVSILLDSKFKKEALRSLHSRLF